MYDYLWYEESGREGKQSAAIKCSHMWPAVAILASFYIKEAKTVVEQSI